MSAAGFLFFLVIAVAGLVVPQLVEANPGNQVRYPRWKGKR